MPFCSGGEKMRKWRNLLSNPHKDCTFNYEFFCRTTVSARLEKITGTLTITVMFKIFSRMN